MDTHRINPHKLRFLELLAPDEIAAQGGSDFAHYRSVVPVHCVEPRLCQVPGEPQNSNPQRLRSQLISLSLQRQQRLFERLPAVLVVDRRVEVGRGELLELILGQVFLVFADELHGRDHFVGVGFRGGQVVERVRRLGKGRRRLLARALRQEAEQLVDDLAVVQRFVCLPDSFVYDESTLVCAGLRGQTLFFQAEPQFIQTFLKQGNDCQKTERQSEGTFYNSKLSLLVSSASKQ